MDQQNLLVRFRLDNQQAISQATAFERAIRDQNKAMQSSVPAAKAYGQATAGVGKNAKAIKLFAQQASFQIADFAIVMQQGQGFMRAFAIQGGQLLGFLPGYGAIIGGVVTVVGLLGQSLIEALGAGKDFDDMLGDLNKTIDRYQELAEVAALNTEGLVEKFNTSKAPTIASAADIALLVQQQRALLGLTNQYEKLISEIEDTTGSLINITPDDVSLAYDLSGALEDLAKSRDDAFAEGRTASARAFSSNLSTMQMEFERLGAGIVAFGDELGITKDQLIQFVEAFNRMGSAQTVDEMLVATSQLAGVIQDAEISAKDLERVFGENVDQLYLMIEAALEFEAAVGSASYSFEWLVNLSKQAVDNTRQMASNLWDAVKARSELAMERAGFEDRRTSEERFQVKQAEYDALVESGSRLQSTIAGINAERAIEVQRAKENSEWTQIEIDEQINTINLLKDRAIQTAELDAQTKEFYSNQKSGAAGAKKAQSELNKEQERFAKLIASEKEASSVTFFDIASAGIDGFVDALFDADKSFKDFARDFLITVGKMIAKQFLLNWLVTALGGGKGPTLVQGVSQAQMLGMQAVNAIPFAKGGIIGAPSYFMNQGKLSQAGEAGPEAIMPLSRTSSGDLGVAGPSIVVNNYTGQEVSIDRTEEIIAISVGQARKAVESDFSRQMASGQGVYPRSLESGYSSRRRVK